MSETDEKDQKIADLEAKLEKAEGEVEKWKGLSRKNEDRAKENADAAEELKKLKDADKTDAQKAADEAAAEKKRADEAEAKRLRLEVALDKAPEGMSLAQVRKLSKRLTGANEDELAKDAEELFADFAPDKGDGDGDDKKDDKDGKDDKSGSRPKEDLKSGSVPDAKADEVEPGMGRLMRAYASPDDSK